MLLLEIDATQHNLIALYTPDTQTRGKLMHSTGGADR